MAFVVMEEFMSSVQEPAQALSPDERVRKQLEQLRLQEGGKEGDRKATLREETDKKIGAVIAKVPLPNVLWGKIGSFLPTKEATDLSQERSISDLMQQRGRQKAAIATAAAAAEASPSPRVTDAEKKGIAKFAGEYWAEAAQGDFASQFVQELIEKKASIPYTFPPQFEGARRNVQQLSLEHCKNITPDILRELHRCFPNLTSLNLKGCNINDEAVQIIASQWKQLRNLNLRSCFAITNAACASLASLTQLRTLNLFGCSSIDDAGLGFLAPLTQLQDLNLSNCGRITDAGLAFLASLTQLRILNLSACWNITDTGVASLASLTQLHTLDLMSCGEITGTGFAALARTQLQNLNLCGCSGISDDGLASLARLAQLQNLNLSVRNSIITDKGLLALVPLKELRILDLRTCPKITDAGVQALRERIQSPHVQIRRS